ncbi:hypothetical protein D3C86_2034190 [compost metagenome]
MQPAIAHFVEAPQPLDHRKDVLDPCTDLGLLAVALPLRLVGHTVDLAHSLVRAVQRRWRLVRDQLLLARIRAVAVHAQFFAMQQIG